MYNIKINTLPVLTKLIYKSINAQGLITLTTKENIQLKKELEKNYGKLVAISIYYKTHDQYISYIGSFSYIRPTEDDQDYTIPIYYEYSGDDETLHIVNVVIYNDTNKTLTIGEI
jgi:hypothetical protein